MTATPNTAAPAPPLYPVAVPMTAAMHAAITRTAHQLGIEPQDVVWQCLAHALPTIRARRPPPLYRRLPLALAHRFTAPFPALRAALRRRRLAALIRECVDESLPRLYWITEPAGAADEHPLAARAAAVVTSPQRRRPRPH